MGAASGSNLKRVDELQNALRLVALNQLLCVGVRVGDGDAAVVEPHAPQHQLVGLCILASRQQRLPHVAESGAGQERVLLLRQLQQTQYQSALPLLRELACHNAGEEREPCVSVLSAQTTADLATATGQAPCLGSAGAHVPRPTAAGPPAEQASAGPASPSTCSDGL